MLMALMLFALPLRAAEPVVLASIKPLGWIVQSLAPAGADVQVLLADGQSPHDYQLKPADMARIHNSALTVWVGPGLEPWLAHVVENVPGERYFALLPNSEHHHEEGEDHDDDGDAAHAHASTLEDINRDPHVWLDAHAMQILAVPLAARLQKLYPAKTEEIREHLAQFQKNLQAVDAEMAAQFAPVATRGFAVYHDGYSRLVQRYGLQQRAAVWHHESIAAGARERAALLKLLNSGDVSCLFYEPEHGRDAVNGWLGSAATRVTMVELDPLGQNITPGDNAYPRFLRALAAQMAGCLRGA